VADEVFSNRPLDVAALPQLSDDHFVAVHRNYLRVSLIGSAIFAVIVIGVCGAVAALMSSYRHIPLLVMGALLLLTAIGAVLKIAEVRNIGYQVREHDLSYRAGVLVKVVQTVPFVRVQHAQVAQGPVERRFGLATLTVNSAGPDLLIAGLAADDAARLNALVVERAGDLVEEQ
jgi:membrane protein YdbS with pleckstrin-like domain